MLPDDFEFRTAALLDPPATQADPPFSALRDTLTAKGMDSSEAYEAFKSGKDFEYTLPELTPISNQGSSGTCVPHATLDAAEHVMAQGSGRPPEQASVLFSYYQCLLRMGEFPLRDSGTWPRLMYESFSIDGMCPDRLWPFVIERLLIPPPDLCHVAASSNRLTGAYLIDATDEERIDQLAYAILVAQHPVTFATEVGQDWMAYRGTRDTDAPFAPPVTSKGRHEMGWFGMRRRAGRIALYTRNSWGRGWGLGGYGWMDQTYVMSSITTNLWCPTSVPILRSFWEENTTAQVTEDEVDQIKAALSNDLSTPPPPPRRRR